MKDEEFIVLQQRDPFKTIFKYLKNYGMWMDVSVKHRVLGFTAFLLLNLSSCILIALSLLDARNMEDFTRSTIYSFIYLISFFCTINFYIKRNEIHDFIDDLNQVLNDDPQVMNNFIEIGFKKCNRMFHLTFRISFFIMGTGTIIGPLIFGKVEMPMWFLSHPNFFYVAWIFQNLSSFYTIYLTIFNIELLCNLLIMLHTYIEYFEYKLKTLNWKSRREIIKCINIHWNIKR